MTVSAAVPASDPLMIAWTAYKNTQEYSNSWLWASKGADYVEGSMWAAFEQGLRASQAQVLLLTGEVEAAQSHRALYAKTLFDLKDTLLNVTDEVVDEGDRVYFGSSNHADALRDVTQEIDALHWDELLAHTQPKVNLYGAIANRIAERDAALAQVEGLRKALEPFAKMARLIDRYYAEAPDNTPFRSGGAWQDSETGEPRTITIGDFRLARSALNPPSTDGES